MKRIACCIVLAPAIAAAAPARVFHGLHAGASWDFPAERIVGGFQGSGYTSEITHGSVHCELGEVHAIARGDVALTLACSGMENVSQLSGDYVASGRGLARLDDPDAPAPLLAQRVVAIPGRRDKVTCFRWDIAAGDEAGWELCLTAASGIVGGSAYTAGGYTDDTYFGDVPRH